ncbi:hypothetical protein GGR56DRAFT_651687 [Xylariaceae sp. FL0804]|nr:hypothetical protein GGR56DRAFT_651687 [Xylariaceae sp. FL0804]
MGFTTGFTGGVTLTLSIAYLTALAHQRNREAQAAVLRRQTLLLTGVFDPRPPPLPPTRAERAAAERAGLAEQLKDRWNAEVEGAVRWAQHRDWDAVREGVEFAVARAWARLLGRAEDAGAAAEQRAAEAAETAGDALAEGRDAAQRGAGATAAAARDAYADARARGSDALSDVRDTAQDARGGVMDAIGRGLARGREALGQAKASVAGAESKAEAALEGAGAGASPVDRALRQRYEKPTSSAREPSPEEVLAARYLPTEQKDHANLKAL